MFELVFRVLEHTEQLDRAGIKANLTFLNILVDKAYGGVSFSSLGADQGSPRENLSLFNQLAEQGTIVSSELKASRTPATIQFNLTILSGGRERQASFSGAQNPGGLKALNDAYRTAFG